MSRLPTPGSPCSRCSRNCPSSHYGEQKGCAVWQEWFRFEWTRTRRRLLALSRRRRREIWVYYSPDEMEAARNETENRVSNYSR